MSRTLAYVTEREVARGPLDKEELGRRLKKAREAVGLTQENVAAQVGISRGALAQFEGGASTATCWSTAIAADW